MCGSFDKYLKVCCAEVFCCCYRGAECNESNQRADRRSQCFAAMGQKPTEEELFQMISEVDENMSGAIDFGEFLKVIEKQKERASRYDDESDMGACGRPLHRPPVLCKCSADDHFHALSLDSSLVPLAVDAFVACGGMREC